jgi:integrase
LIINGRTGLGFYSLRHTFAPIALRSGDRDAVRSLMGHATHDVLAAYDETGPSDVRLRAVVEYVYQWLIDGE